MLRRLPLVAALVVEVVAILFLQWKILGVGHVIGGSMAPTIPTGSGTLVNRLDRSASDGDIVEVAADTNFDGKTELIVKRVLAVGGETISCCDTSGAVVRNGHRLREPYVKDDDHQAFCAGGADVPCPVGVAPVLVPAHHIWLMGDHRGTSIDSRRYRDPARAAPPESAVQGTIVGHYSFAGAYLRFIACTGTAVLPASLATFLISSRLARRTDEP